ncbi:hypothetical protein DKX38_020385 [Salix brachista]|uniref:Uncharacterized protein n=1 Tax=Salix brachista TaxID=2182728 RepID=A0A5N5K5B3_9ROSI|nr:hypothetical protein DKX38_020385 [Salix brachista]
MEKGPYDLENKPFMLETCLSGEAKGAGREAFLIVETFPFETTYTVQKSGAPLDTVLDIANQSSELRRIYKILLVL